MNIMKSINMCDNSYDGLKLKYGLCKQFDDMICYLKSIRDADKPYDCCNAQLFISYSMMVLVNTSLEDMATMRAKMIDS